MSTEFDHTAEAMKRVAEVARSEAHFWLGTPNADGLLPPLLLRLASALEDAAGEL